MPNAITSLATGGCGIEKGFRVQIIARLADEMHFVENDLGRSAEMPEARRDRGDDQHRDDDGVLAYPSLAAASSGSAALGLRAFAAGGAIA